LKIKPFLKNHNGKPQRTQEISGALLKIGKQPIVEDFVVLLDQLELGSRIVVNIQPRKRQLNTGLFRKKGLPAITY
jgi:hypothetical protein